MSEQFYEPFGEPLSPCTIPVAVRENGSFAISYAGVTLFWIIVFTIVTARAFLLDSDIEKAFAIAKTYLDSAITLLL